MTGDTISDMQSAVKLHLSAIAKGSILLNGMIGVSVPWRPHIYQVNDRVGWQLHSVVPESSSWERRILRASAADARLKIGVAATEGVLLNSEFQLACQRLNARVLLLKGRKGGFVVDDTFGSIPDFVCERNVKLDLSVARRMLDAALDRALAAKTKTEKGVSLEIVVALLLSQIDEFEVANKGISNRTQQMDVLVHNRCASGVLSSSPIVLAEAKNWRQQKVTPTEHASFLRKLASRNGRAKLGFLVTTGKFTSGVALEARRDSLGDIIVVCVDGDCLPKIWRGPETITRKIERLVLDASVGS